MRNISPSVLSADFSKLKEQLEIVESSGASRLHLDVMDGNFVPNLTFGPIIIKAIRKLTNMHLETHLMINNPHDYIQEYADAGSDTIIFHYEASTDIDRDIKLIKKNSVKSGIAINPDTNIKKIHKYLKKIDYVLIMSVFPGFGGQEFIEDTLKSMKYLSKLKNEFDFIIGVDGGVNLKTIDAVYKTGIDVTIVGSALYGADDIPNRFKQLMTIKND